MKLFPYAMFAAGAVAGMASAYAASAQPPQPVLSLSISENPVVLGNNVTLTAHSSIVPVGIKFQVSTVSYTQPDSNGDGVIDSLDPIYSSITWTSLNGSGTDVDASGYATYTFDPLTWSPDGGITFPFASPGCYVIRAQSDAGPNSAGLSLRASQSPGYCLQVNAGGCTSGVILKADFAGGPSPVLKGTDGTWTYTIKVHACEDIVAGAKVQGGNAAWLNLTGAVQTMGDVTVRTTKKNSIITWILPALTAGQEASITITQQGKATTVGESVTINGPWSIVYQTTHDAALGNPAVKSDYTDQITIAVQ